MMSMLVPKLKNFFTIFSKLCFSACSSTVWFYVSVADTSTLNWILDMVVAFSFVSIGITDTTEYCLGSLAALVGTGTCLLALASQALTVSIFHILRLRGWCLRLNIICCKHIVLLLNYLILISLLNLSKTDCNRKPRKTDIRRISLFCKSTG